MKLQTKCFKRFVIQHYDCNIDAWSEIKCKYNGKYNEFISSFEGNSNKPTCEDLEDAKITVSNFSDSMFRVAEKTYVIIEEANKVIIR